MLLTLCEYSVPMLRATWFIKMTSFYHESKMAESKMKRKPQIDLSQGLFKSVYITSMIIFSAMFKQNLLDILSSDCIH